MERNRVNAMADVASAAKEFGLQILNVEVSPDEFGRRDRVLKLTLGKQATTIGSLNRAACAVLDVAGSMHWDVVLHADTKSEPCLWVRLDDK